MNATRPIEEWVMPVDYAILRRLPKQGSRLGYHVLATTVRIVTDQINEGVPPEAHMTSGVVSTRVARWLKPQGMVVEVRVHGARGAKGYQITEAGERMLAAAPEGDDA